MALSAKTSVHRNTRKHCGVFGCASKNNPENLNLSYHLLPQQKKSSVEITNKFGVREDVDRRAEWIKRLMIQNPFPNLRVCSAHFVPEDYFFPEIDAAKRQLKKHAVPSRNLPVSSVVTPTSQVAKRQESERTERVHKRQKIVDCRAKEKHTKVADSTSCISDAVNQDISPIVERLKQETEEEFEFSPSDRNIAAQRSQPVLHSDDADEPLCLRKCFCTVKDEKISNSTNKVFEVPSDEILVPFSSILASDRKLNSFCGIHSHKLLDHISCAMERLYPEKRVCKLTLRDKIIMTMMRLKMDLSFRALSVLFDSVSEETCSAIFYDTLKKLSTILKPMISWLSKEETMRNMPQSFASFENTMVVVDCIEFLIKKPKCLTCQKKAYSQYKSDYTTKIMTGVSPGGLLVFVSEAYGGRASDKLIFEQSNIIDLMNRGDAVMTDKGFMVDDICNKNGVQMYRPSFLKKKSQLSKAETLYNRKIACATEHVQRMNQRISEFDVLQNRIDSNLPQNIDDIMIVCCALANLGTPILTDDQFM